MIRYDMIVLLNTTLSYFAILTIYRVIQNHLCYCTWLYILFYTRYLYTKYKKFFFFYAYY